MQAIDRKWRLLSRPHAERPCYDVGESQQDLRARRYNFRRANKLLWSCCNLIYFGTNLQNMLFLLPTHLLMLPIDKIQKNHDSELWSLFNTCVKSCINRNPQIDDVGWYWAQLPTSYRGNFRNPHRNDEIASIFVTPLPQRYAQLDIRSGESVRRLSARMQHPYLWTTPLQWGHE